MRFRSWMQTHLSPTYSRLTQALSRALFHGRVSNVNSPMHMLGKGFTQAFVCFCVQGQCDFSLARGNPHPRFSTCSFPRLHLPASLPPLSSCPPACAVQLPCTIGLHGYLAHQKQPPRRTLQYDYA